MRLSSHANPTAAAVCLLWIIQVSSTTPDGVSRSARLPVLHRAVRDRHITVRLRPSRNNYRGLITHDPPECTCTLTWPDVLTIRSLVVTWLGLQAHVREYLGSIPHGTDFQSKLPHVMGSILRS